MKLNKKGFTLVELLAVIVILAIILAIAVPSITGILNSAKKSSFEADVKLIIKGIEYKMLEANASNTTGPVIGQIDADDLVSYGADSSNYVISATDGEGCRITALDPVSVVIESTSNSEFGAYTATGTRNTLTIE